jgi:hypothetical protein
MPLASLPGVVIHSACDLVFKHDAFRFTRNHSSAGSEFAKIFEIVAVVDLLDGINVDPDVVI